MAVRLFRPTQSAAVLAGPPTVLKEPIQLLMTAGRELLSHRLRGENTNFLGQPLIIPPTVTTQNTFRLTGHREWHQVMGKLDLHWCTRVPRHKQRWSGYLETSDFLLTRKVGLAVDDKIVQFQFVGSRLHFQFYRMGTGGERM